MHYDQKKINISASTRASTVFVNIFESNETNGESKLISGATNDRYKCIFVAELFFYNRKTFIVIKKCTLLHVIKLIVIFIYWEFKTDKFDLKFADWRKVEIFRSITKVCSVKKFNFNVSQFLSRKIKKITEKC